MFEGAIPKPADWLWAQGRGDQGDAGTPPAMRVLLAEDTPISADMMGAMAEHLGCHMDIAANGAEAIALIRIAARSGRPYKLLLLDVMMPVLDGIETTRRLRDEGFDADSLPIIAVTAATDLDEIRSYRKAGMQAFLSKPVRLADLDAALAAWGNVRHGQLQAGAPSEWAAFQEQFAKRKRNAITQIQAALDAPHMDEDLVASLRAILHQLAGTAGSFGENELSERSRKHEAALVSAHLNNGDIKAVLREAKQSLEENQ